MSGDPWTHALMSYPCAGFAKPSTGSRQVYCTRLTGRGSLHWYQQCVLYRISEDVPSPSSDSSVNHSQLQPCLPFGQARPEVDTAHGPRPAGRGGRPINKISARRRHTPHTHHHRDVCREVFFPFSFSTPSCTPISTLTLHAERAAIVRHCCFPRLDIRRGTRGPSLAADRLKIDSSLRGIECR